MVGYALIDKVCGILPKRPKVFDRNSQGVEIVHISTTNYGGVIAALDVGGIC